MTDLPLENTPMPQPSSPAKPFPGFAQALLVMLLLLVFSGITGIPLAIFQALKWNQAMPWAALASQVGATALTLWVCTAMGSKSWRDYFPHRPVAPTVWPLVILGTAGLILLSNGAEGLLQRILPTPEWLKNLFGDMGWQGMVVGAPLTEEPLFRALVLGGFVQRYGPRKGLLLSALLFGLIHLNPWQLTTAIAAGLFLGWLMLRTGSLWPGVLAHFVNNLVAYLSTIYHTPYLGDQRLQPIWMWGLGALFAFVAIWGLARVFAPDAVELRTEEALP